jgi:hypothetical protein
MRVGAYIDGFNLYYGARDFCRRGTPGWRWLDLEALATDLVNRRVAWVQAGAAVTKVVYCTARIPIGQQEQDVYLTALTGYGTVTYIEYGQYVSRVKKAPLAVEGPNGWPQLVRATNWPVKVQDRIQRPVPDAIFMVSHARREEKASDVNVASHLLVDALESNIDAAIVISNDSDLRYPIREARRRIPVGTVNPSPAQLAGALKGAQSDGVGGHWWLRLGAQDYYAHQLPDPCAGQTKPGPW